MQILLLLAGTSLVVIVTNIQAPRNMNKAGAPARVREDPGPALPLIDELLECLSVNQWQIPRCRPLL